MWLFTSFLSIAACISYPEVTTVEETRDAPVSLDGSTTTERINLGDDRGPDAAADGGVLPHPDRDARADSSRVVDDDDPPDDDDDDDDETEDGGSGAGSGPGKGKGKGKPPKREE